MFFRYTAFLERENQYLKDRITLLEQRNEELIVAMCQKSIPVPAPAKAGPKHAMTKTETSASCSCGWHTHSDDPIELHKEISAHYRENITRLTRKSWPQAKQALEAHGEENAN